MEKSRLKLYTDIIMFSSFTTLLFTGLLMWLVIPTGHSGHPYLLGLHRHDWGDIHLFFSIIFALSSFFHIYLNWTLSITMVKNIFGEDKRYLLYIGLSFFPITIIAWIFKLIIK